jgi:hypothetical protein
MNPNVIERGFNQEIKFMIRETALQKRRIAELKNQLAAIVTSSDVETDQTLKTYRQR